MLRSLVGSEMCIRDRNYVVADGSTGEVVLSHYGTQKLATKSTGLEIKMATDKNISFTGGIGEIGSVPGFQGTTDGGAALTSIGMRGVDIRFATQAAEEMRITSDGFVGIGTDSPDANSLGAGSGILTVASDTGSAKTAMLNLVGDGNDTDATRVASLFYNDASATGAGATLAGIEAYRASNHATDPGADLVFSTNLFA